VSAVHVPPKTASSYAPSSRASVSPSEASSHRTVRRPFSQLRPCLRRLFPTIGIPLLDGPPTSAKKYGAGAPRSRGGQRGDMAPKTLFRGRESKIGKSLVIPARRTSDFEISRRGSTKSGTTRPARRGAARLVNPDAEVWLNFDSRVRNFENSTPARGGAGRGSPLRREIQAFR